MLTDFSERSRNRGNAAAIQDTTPTPAPAYEVGGAQGVSANVSANIPRQESLPLGSGKYPWKTRIVTTVFCLGGSTAANSTAQKHTSSCDRNWKESFGGYDNPDTAKRTGFIPAAFVPKLNPFYCALPYNDITKGGHKPEARAVVPWFKQAFVREGQSVCRDRWIAIRNNSGHGLSICRLKRSYVSHSIDVHQLSLAHRLRDTNNCGVNFSNGAHTVMLLRFEFAQSRNGCS